MDGIRESGAARSRAAGVDRGAHLAGVGLTFEDRVAEQHDFFERGDVVITRAPGRLDVMGGIADYSGSLVLELPLDAATFVAAQLTDDAHVTVRTLTNLGAGVDATVRVPLNASRDEPISRDDMAAALSDQASRWAGYVLGALNVLARVHGARITRGVRLLIDSTVPPGKGVASSAALEVSAMRAMCELYGVALDGRALALACQRVENVEVGVPCGVMDQMTSACGTAGELLAIRCQPAEIEGGVRIPDGLELWGIDSGIRHEIGGAEYGDVRTGAFMGLRILSTLAPDADARWDGYLANVTPDEWEERFRARVPETIRGDAFLAQFGGIADTVTRVDPARTYAVRQPTAHPIHENHRVRHFRDILQSGAHSETDRGLLGELMYVSHASYSACGLGSSGTDRLAALVREAKDDGLYGAKITGGGSGGVVAVLARSGSLSIVEAIARAYAAETGRETAVLGGSSPGAIAFGTRTQRLT
jgi:galactokinase